MSAQAARCRAHGHRTWSGTWRNVQADVRRQLATLPASSAEGANFKRKLGAFLRPEILSLFLHRTSHFCHVSGWPRLGRTLCRLNYLLHKVNITPQSCIGAGCRLPHPPGVFFHGQAGRELTVFSLAVCTGAEHCPEGPVENGPHLGDRVLLGAHAVVIGPVTVGSDTKIPYSVRLAQDAPPGVIVASKNLRLTYRGRARS
jgi:serine O-acetyltransferase